MAFEVKGDLRSVRELRVATDLIYTDTAADRIGINTAAPAVTLDIVATDAIRLPAGTTAERPGAPGDGMIRYNSTLAAIEAFIAGAWTTLNTGGTVTSVDVQPGTAGLATAGGPITTAGTITVSLADDVLAIENLGTTGFAVRTAASTWTTRSITGVAGRIVVNDGDGVAANPQIDLATTGVVAGVYGAASQVPQVTVDSYGRLTNALNVPIAIVSGQITDFVEAVQDVVGGMVSGNTELGISVTYDDPLGKLNFDVNDFTITLTGDVSGSGTVTNLSNVTINTTIQPDSVALGTDTTGNYVSGILGTANEIDVTNGVGEGVTATIGISDNPILPGNASVTVPAGTTLERPGAPVNGMLRYNSTNQTFEFYQNSTWETYVTGFDVVAGTPGLSIAGAPIDVTGTITVSLADDVLAVENIVTTGIAVRTAANTWTTRSIQGTANQIAVGNGSGVAGNPTISIATDPVIPGTGAMIPPSGTTAQRPASPVAGMIRYNSTIGRIEFFQGGTWESPDPGTVTSVDVQPGTPGLATAGGPITTSGTITVSLADDMLAIENLGTLGIAVRTAASTWATRTIQAAAGRTVVTNGSGVAGDPLIDLDVTGVAAGSYGTPSEVPQITVDAYGRITNVVNLGINIVSGQISDLTEAVEDIVGAMVSGNTEQGITVTYDDPTGKLNFDVNDFTITLQGDIAGSGTVTNLTNVTINTTIQPNSVALGTDTTGNYVATITGTANQIDVTNGVGEGVATTIGIAQNPTIPGSQYLAVPAGTTAQRPAVPSNGMLRYNTVTGRFEFYQSGAWVEYSTTAETVSSIDVQPGTAGLATAGGPITSAGVITVSLADDVLAIESLGGVGFAVRTAANTWAQRSITGTAGRITVTNGDGVAGSPQIDLAATGVAAGTYTRVTVDAYGRVTAASQASISDLLAPTANVSWGGFRITNLASPVASTDAATKGYVDTVATGTDWKDAVRVKDTTPADTAGYTYNPGSEPGGLVWTNVTAAPVWDGVTVNDGDRILITNAGDARGRGIFTYDAAGQGFRRAPDADNTPSNEVSGGIAVFVLEGTQYEGSGWVLVDPDGDVTLGADGMTWAQFGGTNLYTASNGITLVGQDFQLTGQASLLHNLATTGLITRAGAGSIVTRAIQGTANEIAVTNGDGVAGNPTVALAADPIVPGVASITVPKGTTAQRPGAPASGMVRFNTTIGRLEVYNGSAWQNLESGTVTSVNVQSGGAGLTTAGGPITTSGTITVSLANDLAALEALGGVGFAVRTAADTWAQRSIQGTANQIAVSSGDGVAASPTISIAQNPTLPGTSHVLIPTGTTAQRPGAPVNGMIRYNTTTGKFEFYENGAWINYTSGGGTVTSVDVQPGTAGLSTAGGPITTAGTITVSLANDVLAIENLTTTGIAVRTAADTWTTRTIQGTAGRIAVSNGDGVAGNPTVDLSTSGVAPGVYGSASQVAQVTVDAYGRITAAANVGISITSTAITDFTEAVQDVVGGMVTGNTENGITVTYDDPTGKLNFDVNDFTITLQGDVAGSGTVTNLTNVTINCTIQPNSVALGGDTTGNYVASITGTGNQITVTNGVGEGVAASIAIANNPIIPGVESLTVPIGTTAQRPAAPANGMVRYNTTINRFEFYENGSWLSYSSSGGTVTSVDVQPGTAGLSTAGGPITTAGTITISLANDVLALENLAGTGFAVRTAANTWAQRSITGTAGRILITNGDGVAGNPVVDLAASGVTAGNYGSATQVATFTVDTYGRLTLASNVAIAIPSTAITDFQEAVEDVVGAMVTGNTENGITVTYDDPTGKLNFDVNDFTITLQGDVAGSGTVTNLSNVTINCTIQPDSVALGTDTTGNYVATIGGTASQITVTNGSGEGVNATISIANNPTIPGTAAMRVPTGTTAQRPGAPANGMLRYNTTTNAFEGYQNGSWTAFGGSGTVTSVDVQPGTAGLATAGGPITTNGTITVSLANDMLAIENLGGTGFAVRTGADTWAQRSITGTAGRITVANADGVPGNPVIDLVASGVLAGVYGSASQVPQITVDAYGRITAASNVGISITSAAISDFQEAVEDVVGAMVTGNTEAGISVTYDDAAGKLNFDVNDFTITLTGDISGVGAVNNLSNVSIACTIQPNSVGLGTDTTGNYIAGITGSANQITVTNGAGEGVTANIAIASDPTIPGAGAMRIPTGTTAQRPGAPADGMVRYNSTLAKFEFYENGAWTSYGSGSGTVTSVDVSAGTAGLTTAGGPITTAGTITVSLTNDVLALENLAGTGFSARTAADTWALRTITGTGGRVTVTNGDGVAGNPQIDLATTGVAAGNYGSATQVATFTVDTYGRLTLASNVAIAIPSTAITDFQEAVEDVVGAMVTGNTENGITVTYDDPTGKLNFDVNDFTITLQGDVAGSGTVTNLTNVTINTTIQPNSVALGTDTTGNYVANVQGTANQITASGGPGEGVTITVGLATDAVFPGTGAVTVPVGTTAQRPAAPSNGMMRYNSSTNKFEFYENGAWVGLGSGGGRTKDVFTGDGVTTSFTLSKAPTSANDIIVVRGSVIQEPTQEYTVAGTTLTFPTAPGNGVRIWVIHL